MKRIIYLCASLTMLFGGMCVASAQEQGTPKAADETKKLYDGDFFLGIGGGIEVWRLQISARYNWDFGTLYDVAGWDDIKDHFDELNAESSSFGGVTLNLSFFF